ncbi:MAG: DUF4382 domain-containing protein [Halapricum sp.]
MRDTTSTYRREYLMATGAVGLAGAIGLAGCSETTTTGTDTATGKLATAVKDAPGDIDDFESCTVTIEGIWIKPDGDDEETEGTDDEPPETDDGEPTTAENGTDDGTATPADDESGTEEDIVTQDAEDVDEDESRTYYEFDEPQEADLVQLQDGNTKLVDDREVPVGNYQFLQLDVSNVEGTLADGGEAEVDTPGNAPLQFKQAFEVRAGQRTVFTADFTPVKRGRTNRYLFQPVASGTEVSYETITATEADGTETTVTNTTTNETTTAKETTTDNTTTNESD